MISPARAEETFSVAYPPSEHQTTANQIFLVGTAPAVGEVLVNGKPINRSPAGHFAPSFPLKVGENLFTLRYQNQQIQIKVKRVANVPVPIGLAFAKNSLIPSVDIARLPGEVICFSAIAPANADVSVLLGGRTIPLMPQSQQVNLPANSAALIGKNQPFCQTGATNFQGCTTAPLGENVNRFGTLEYREDMIAGKAVETESDFDWGKPEFQLTLNGKTITQPGAGKITILSPAQLAVAEVTADSGVARTGPSTDYSRLTPLPKGTRAKITGREGNWLRLDYGGWIDSKETNVLHSSAQPLSLIRSITARQIPGATEIVFPLQVPVPVSVQQGDRTFSLTLHNTTAQTEVIRLDDDPIISRLDWHQVAPTQVQYTFNLKSGQQWGYKLRYEGTSLVLTLRHAPRKELKGIKILLDPGHGGSELGAKGPTGYPEKDINLLISKLVKEQLEQRGAIVYMTREEDKEVSLAQRVALIDKLEPAIALSLHYNALPDDGDAINTKGFSAYWYHPQAHDLAVFLNNYVVKKLDRPDYGVFWKNLALTRPATAPSVLLELGFMINPYEFEWIVDHKEQRKLALAIADGVAEWLEERDEPRRREEREE